MLKESQNAETLAGIICFLSRNNIDFSDNIGRVLLKAYYENTDLTDELGTIMTCISRFLSIDDFYWKHRAEAILGFAAPYPFEKNLMTEITDDKYIYHSNLEGLFPVESMLYYAHNNAIKYIFCHSEPPSSPSTW